MPRGPEAWDEAGREVELGAEFTESESTVNESEVERVDLNALFAFENPAARWGQRAPPTFTLSPA